ncbi:hypothetical protein FRC08_002708 [Ceratobasidium sp. 394]|nr:hypothetical protein FRC08_002708 [Ceratobasidium sp. 394]KAG9073403.1 hypothetical protein FS749_015271 [Ceratobasidium sp. UAMH 11750]
MAGASADQAPSFSFQPPAGGDVWLKASDGTIFIAHSMFLAFSSKVFSDMFASATKADVVELAEDAETVSLMLAFIYPAVRPPINTIPLLEKAVLTAHKYEIEFLAKSLEQIVVQQRALVRQDPLRVFRLATDCGLHELQAFSAELMTPYHCDMTTVNGLTRLAKEYPESSRIIGLVGAQGARARVFDTISPENSTTLWPAAQAMNSWPNMICNSCWKGSGNQVGSRYRPGWLSMWFERLRSALTNKLWDECDSYFELSRVTVLRGTTSCCAACVDNTCTKVGLFGEWAKDARLHLQEKLAELDVLYTL